MTRRTRMILIRAAVVVFLLYAVVNVVNLRTQIKSKRDELASLTLRVEEYQKANETLRQEMQSGNEERSVRDAEPLSAHTDEDTGDDADNQSN